MGAGGNLKTCCGYKHLPFGGQPAAASLRSSDFGPRLSGLAQGKSWMRGGLLTILVLLFGCGYQFSGAGSLRGGVQHLFIPVLDNRTTETGLETIFTSNLRSEFIRYNRFAAQDAADAVLSGTIRSLRVRTVSRKTEHSSLERRVTVSVDFKLADREGKVSWSVTGLQESETYRVESNSQATEANKRAAISLIAKRLAETIYYRLTENF